MSIFTRDMRPYKLAMHAAVEQFKKDQNIGVLMLEVADFRAAYKLGPSFVTHCQKLAMASAPDKILRLVDVVDDTLLRAWVRIPLLILISPFLFLARLVKMFLP